MILTDREIQIALEHGSIKIEPAPKEEAYSSTSVDLTLDPNLSEFIDHPQGVETVIDPGAPGFSHENVLSTLLTKATIPSDGYVFKPGKLILAWTKEYVELPLHGRIAARVESKSSLARLGIAVHITAPTIHAGFGGQIRLEMYNHGKLPIRLRADMKICQLIVEQTLGVPVQGYKGRFAAQTSAKKKG